MNRNKSLGLSNLRKDNRERRSEDDFGMMKKDAFDNFDRMFEGFGMMRGFSRMDKIFGDFESQFNNIESNFYSSPNKQGTVITKSYVSKVKYDRDGQPQKETYKTQSIKQTDREGKSIQEKQQAYQNTKSGVMKAAHERLLNDKGLKVVKSKNRFSGEEYEHNIYKGISEDSLSNFNSEYKDYREKVKFENNYELLNNNESRRELPLNSNLYRGKEEKPRALPDFKSRR